MCLRHHRVSKSPRCHHAARTHVSATKYQYLPCHHRLCPALRSSKYASQPASQPAGADIHEAGSRYETRGCEERGRLSMFKEIVQHGEGCRYALRMLQMTNSGAHTHSARMGTRKTLTSVACSHVCTSTTGGPSTRVEIRSEDLI